MRDDDHRPTDHERLQRFEQLLFGDRVEVGRRFVEDQDRRILEDGARDGQALALAAAEQQAVLADERVVLRGKPSMKSCNCACRQAATICSSVASGLASSRLSRTVALNRCTCCGTTPSNARTSSARYSCRSRPPSGDLPLVVVPEAQQQIHHRRFARSARADDRDAAARRDREAHTVERRRIRSGVARSARDQKCSSSACLRRLRSAVDRMPGP